MSKAEAQTIIGGPIDTPLEAPLGPTCMYKALGARNLVTLTVESISFAKVKPQIRNLKQVNIRGRAAYCGHYGRPMTFVPLAGGQVLNITAPCAVGALFAAKALPRLTS